MGMRENEIGKFREFFYLLGRKLEAELEKEQVVQALNTQVAEKEQSIQTLSTRIEEREQAEQTLSAQVMEEDQSLQALTALVAAKEQSAQTLSTQVAEKEQSVQALSVQVAEKEQVVQGLNAQVAEKEHIVQVLTAQVAEKEQSVQVLSAQMAENEHTIWKLRDGIEKKECELQLINENKERELQLIKDRLISTQNDLYRFSGLIDEIQSSTAWGIIQRMWQVRRFLAPIGSRRERLGQLCMRAMRVLRNEGLIAFTKAVFRKLIRSKTGRVSLSKSEDSIQPDSRIVHPIDFSSFAEVKARFQGQPPQEPRVSIIIPVYNHADATVKCLESLAKLKDKTRFEIIIIDDGSQDATQSMMTECSELRYFRNEQNMGFLRSCNRAATYTAGEYLVLLNNDTIVQQGWLDNLIFTFEDYPDTGMVGSKIILPNGRLQEAGGVIWADGRAMNYGRGDIPNKPQYSYMREVDYCSGASIMIPRKLWNKLGGFDENYIPAYYEDDDLAFRVREAGYKVRYQPFSQIIHNEGTTSGTDLNLGIKNNQLINQPKFFIRWKNILQNHDLPGQNEDYCFRQRYAKSHILYIDDYTPEPDKNSGSLHTYLYLKILRRQGYAVTFIPAFGLDRAQTDRFRKYTGDLQRLGMECLYPPYINSVRDHLEREGKRYDYVLLCREPVASELIDDVRRFAPQAKIIFYTMDLHFLRLERAAQLSGLKADFESAQRIRERELATMSKVDLTLVCSEVEFEIIKNLHTRSKIGILTVPIEVQGRAATSFQKRKDIVFIGGFGHLPNQDAVLYYIKEIWPLISIQLPGVKCKIVGSEMPKEFSTLASDTVILRGYVENLHDILDDCRLSVAPLRYGAGIKGKIVSSLSFGVPCVATSIAAEGMGLEDGKNILVADTAEQFAELVVRAYTDKKLWYKLSDNGLTTVENRHGLNAIEEQFVRFLTDLKGIKDNKRNEIIQKSTDVNSHFRAYLQMTNNATTKQSSDYVPLATDDFDSTQAVAKLVAFYLPQFHPIPENDAWWGKGFTEWTNVSKAVPQFEGQYQPHLPGELGFYDLRIVDIQKRQIELARKYGIHGFAYYYYWFRGKKLLERPIEQVLAHPELDFPFCITWANESWSRRWDGNEQDVMMPQNHTSESDFEFIKDIEPMLRDRRYIRIGDRPLLIVYRAKDLADPVLTTRQWREYCVSKKIGDPYLVAALTFGMKNPNPLGFDAAVQFPPNELIPIGIDITSSVKMLNPYYSGKVYSYPGLVKHRLQTQDNCEYPLFQTVFPSWDNEPRRSEGGTSFAGSNPSEYGKWLEHAILWTIAHKPPEERFVFINAWNEWAEGTHLEPDRRFGYAYLQTTADILRKLSKKPS
jgi:GT2 family glycosyltransferase/glycosyltransferase involved in cell wall biosynthesis